MFFSSSLFADTYTITNIGDAYTYLPESVNNSASTNTVTISSGFTISGASILQPLLVQKGTEYTITSGGVAIDGNQTFRGLLFLPAYGDSGVANIFIENIAFQNCHDTGGNGSGGGLGAGGGLFVGSGNTVTLTNSSFTNCKATGGSHHEAVALGGAGLGGGGMSEGNSPLPPPNSFPGGVGGIGGGGLGADGGATPSTLTSATGGGGVGGNATTKFDGSAVDSAPAPGGGGGGSADKASGQTGGAALSNSRWGSGGGNGGSSNSAGSGGTYGGGGGGISYDYGTSADGGSATGAGGGGGIGANSGSVAGNGGNGAFGGGGGGGGAGANTTNIAHGGNGGFGGGGGAAGLGLESGVFSKYGRSGDGGFGGGAGYSLGDSSKSGTLGYGAGSASDGTGSGGAALGGAIFIQDGGILTIQGTCSFSENSVASSSGSNPGVAQGADIFIMSGEQISFASDENIEVPNPIQGNKGVGGGTPANGSFEKSGIGTLTLAANNTFDGAVTLNGGTLSIPEESGLGVSSSAVTLSSGTLEFTTGSEPLVKTYDVTPDGITISTPSDVTLAQAPNLGKIGALGLVTKTGTGSLLLTRSTNFFDENFEISEGYVYAAPLTISAPIVTIANDATLVFVIEGTDTFYNEIAGTGGAMIKVGNGTLNIAPSAVFSANTNIEIDEGTLNLNAGAHLAGDIVSILSLGSLTGNGTVTSTSGLGNGGKIIPGNSIGTIAIVGDYTQLPYGTLQSEINNKNEADLLDISGTATLSGTLHVDPIPGIYSNPTTYTILEADGGISGNFTSFTHTDQLNLSVQYLADSVAVKLNTPGVVLPVPLSELINNEIVVADYFFCVPNPVTGDLLTVQDTFFELGPKEFPSALLKVSSQIYGAPSLVNMRSFVQIIENLSSITGCNCDRITINPFGNFYDQRGVWSQYPFKSSTYGFTLNGDHQWTSYLCGGLFATYSYSRVFWDQNIGNAHLNNIYAGPYAKLTYNPASFFLSITGAWNHYLVYRNIVFSGINRTAKSNESGGSLFAQAEGNYDIKLKRIRSIFRITAGGMYGAFWTSFQETGAHSINLFIKSNTTQFIVPYAELSLSKHFLKNRLIPKVYVGWEGLFNVCKNYNQSTFTGNTICTPSMNTASYNQDTNELTLGADMTIKKLDQICCAFGYEFKLGKNFWMQQAHFKLGFSY